MPSGDVGSLNARGVTATPQETPMNPERMPPEPLPPPQPEIQAGRGRSRAKDDQIKRVIKQHPQRDEPRADSVEENETPRP
jgi:hypothetical protein